MKIDKFIKKMDKTDDEGCLEMVLALLDRVSISTAFVPDTDGVLKQQIMVIECGDKRFTSMPQEMEIPLMVATGHGGTIN